MSTCTKWFIACLIPLWGTMSLNGQTVAANTGVSLYTPYTKISVPPGQVVDYSVDIINQSAEIQHVDLTVSGIPKDWSYNMKSGGWDIKQISVLPGEKKSFTCKVLVPGKVNKGSYRFKILGGSLASLPLTITVTAQGDYKTEFTTNQANLEGRASSNFSYNTRLNNLTGEKQLFALKAITPPGWEVIFKANYQQATSIEIEAGNMADVGVEINPPDNLMAGTYKIPVMAIAGLNSSKLDLEVVITGSYAMELSTPQGLLSTSITAGDDRRLELRIVNSGSTVLKNIELKFSAPVNWQVAFDPMNVNTLEPGNAAKVFATIKADKKAIAGDYITEIEAKTPEVSTKAVFRISVKTPMLTGWLGIFIILVALGSIFYLFRKFGRR